jgi:hypothetical protein
MEYSWSYTLPLLSQDIVYLQMSENPVSAHVRGLPASLEDLQAYGCSDKLAIELRGLEEIRPRNQLIARLVPPLSLHMRRTHSGSMYPSYYITDTCQI